MKKILVVILVMLTITLAGCEGVDPVVVIEKEIVEVEIPVIVKEIEIVEVPTIVVETEIVQFETIVEVEVPVEVGMVSKTIFQTAETDLIIFVISKGIESYIMEFGYTDTITSPPTLHFTQIEYQYDGYSVNWFFLEDFIDDASNEVVDYSDFVDEVQDLLYEITWEETEEIYQNIEDMYYNVELEYEEIVVLGESISGTLTMDNYTDILLLKLLNNTQITITVTTSQMFDINLYHTSFVSYEYDDYITFNQGTSTQTYNLPAGEHLLEIENWYDYPSVDYTITITVD